MRRQTAATALGTITLAGALLAACGSSSPVMPPPDATPRLMRSVLALYSGENNRSNETLSPSVQALDETGSALVMDDAWFKYQLQSSGSVASFDRGYQPFFEQPVSSQALKVRGWPHSFVATAVAVSHPSEPAPWHATCGGIFVFQQQRGRGRWRVAWEPSIVDPWNPRWQLAPTVAPVALVDRSLALAPATLATQLAQELAAWGSGGAVPAWLPTSSSLQGCIGLGFLGTLDDQAAQSDGVVTWTVSTQVWGRPGSVVAYRLEHGGALVLAAVSMTRTEAVQA